MKTRSPSHSLPKQIVNYMYDLQKKHIDNNSKYFIVKFNKNELIICKIHKNAVIIEGSSRSIFIGTKKNSNWNFFNI